jgi:hypothetical protein
VESLERHLTTACIRRQLYQATNGRLYETARQLVQAFSRASQLELLKLQKKQEVASLSCFQLQKKMEGKHRTRGSQLELLSTSKKDGRQAPAREGASLSCSSFKEICKASTGTECSLIHNTACQNSDNRAGLIHVTTQPAIKYNTTLPPAP